MSHKIKIHYSLDEIPPAQWNALVQDNHPLTNHAFLNAMEQCGCVGEAFGWLPCHIGVYQDGILTAAMPLYEKHNAYGEFVFDHVLADAWQHSGLHYYPKLVSAVPYTPAIGQRMLIQPGQEQICLPLLKEAAINLAEEKHCSGFHCLFPDTQTQNYLEQSFLSRHDCQFHWHNQNYTTFEVFLNQLKSKKAKNIRQERNRVKRAGVNFRVLNGHQATAKDWQEFTRFYNQTFEEKWGVATFNEAFFKQVAATLPDQIVLVLADLEGRCIAGALMYRSDTTLYGRHWGCIEPVDCLHFEACYYQGIEYCIQHGLQTFEPGAQGEHKIPRGFIPTLTRSSHWLANNPFGSSIAAYFQQEHAAIADYIQECSVKTPYREQIKEPIPA